MSETVSLAEADTFIADLERRIFAYVKAFEELLKITYDTAKYFREAGEQVIARTTTDFLSQEAQEFVCYVLKDPARRPLWILESVIREFEKTGGEEGGNLDLFKNPKLDFLFEANKPKPDQPKAESEDLPEEEGQPEEEPSYTFRGKTRKRGK